jgi:hypothetical protein
MEHTDWSVVKRLADRGNENFQRGSCTLHTALVGDSSCRTDLNALRNA